MSDAKVIVLNHNKTALRGWRRWLFTTDHKAIGTLYLVFSLIMLFAGGFLAMIIRAELFQPGLQLVQPLFYNSLVTMHGLTMIFLAIMPALVGLANWQIPLMIGAPDMALPRINNWSFWLLPFAALLLWSGFLLPPHVPPPALTSASDSRIPIRFAWLATSAKRRGAVRGWGLEPANHSHSG